MDNDFATGYALGSDSNGGNCNNGFGGDAWGGIWGIIILAMVFGWGRGGFGFGGFGGGGASTDPGLQGLATRADVNEAIAFNGVERGISAIQQGICDSTYFLLVPTTTERSIAWSWVRPSQTPLPSMLRCILPSGPGLLSIP